MTSHFTANYLPKKNKSSCPHEHVYTGIHSSFICNSQKLEKMETTWVNQINKLWNNHARKYYSEIKRILTHQKKLGNILAGHGG